MRLLLFFLPAAAGAASCTDSDCPLLEEDFAVEFLQTGARLRNFSRALTATLPIAWVHVPKCGSSFLNTLIHVPGVCPDMPDNLVVDQKSYGPFFLDNFTRHMHPIERCTGLANPHFGHAGIETMFPWQEYAGHYMIMLRQPEQRLLSAYKDMKHTFAKVEKAETPIERKAALQMFALHDRSWGGWPEETLPSEREFAEKAGGCATKLLTRKGMACATTHPPATATEVVEAKRRLRSGFSFVGLTGQWALSMCLFSKTFKLPCRADMFGDARPGPNKESGDPGYDTVPLQGWTDAADGALFEEAKAIFEENLEKYGADEEGCAACWRQAGI